MRTPNLIEACVSACAAFEEAMSRFLGLVFASSPKSGEALDDRWRAVVTLTYAMLDTGNGILAVARDTTSSSGITMLGRALLEQSVNLAYLCVCDAAEHDNYAAHSLAKAYAEMDRSIGGPTSGIRVARRGRPEPHDLPADVQAAVSRFSGRNGKVRDWTNRTVPQRIELIAERTAAVVGRRFTLAYAVLYGAGSEALHGTMFGVIHGLSHDPWAQQLSNSEVPAVRLEKETSALIHLVSTVASLVDVLARSLDTDAARSAQDLTAKAAWRSARVSGGFRDH